MEHLRQHINQHSSSLIRRLTILSIRHHELRLILLAPCINLLEPLNPIPEPGLTRWQLLIANLQPITHTLPESPDGTSLQVTQLAPLIAIDEPNRLEREKRQRKEHIVIEDFT